MWGRSDQVVRRCSFRGKLTVGISAIALCLMTTLRIDAQVSVHVLDSNVGFAAAPDTAFDHNDQIVVSYRHSNEHAVKLVSGTDCSRIQTLYDAGEPGFHSSVVIDSLNFPNVSHFNAIEGLQYTLCGGELFGTETLSITLDGTGFVPVADLDSFDRPYVVYRDSNVAAPLVATFDIQSGHWSNHFIPGPDVAGGSSDRFVTLAVDREDHPVVAYFDDGAPHIIVATLSPGGWVLRSHEIGSSPSGNSGLSLAFDSVGAPHVAYSLDGQIRLLRFGIIGVTSETAVGAGLPVLGPHAMAIDDDDRIHIAYADLADQSLYLATNEFGWSSTLIEAGTAGPNAAAAVALDTQGHWAIAYYDDLNDQLKVAGVGLSPVLLGDLDCDGSFDLDDVPAFALALGDPAAYAVTYEGCNINAADLNCDGLLDGRDVQPFVDAMIGP